VGLRLERPFFERSAPLVAPELLGARLIAPDGIVLRITETEAYTENDPASHSFRGPTKRNAVMFGRPGHLYVYFTYGMHWCANVSTGAVGKGEAVLLRAADIESGLDVITARRKPGTSRKNLTNGPAKLCQALGLNGSHNGIDLCSDLPETAYEIRSENRSEPFVSTTRIGISQGTETLWRFVLADPSGTATSPDYS
jgi:DNA-3-methyladenine glycosylase